MEDFRRKFVLENLPELTPQEQQDAIQSLPPEVRLAGLTAEQIRQYLDRLTAEAPPRKPRRKK